MGQNMLRENMNDLLEQYCYLVENLLFWSTEIKRGTACDFTKHQYGP